MTARWFSFIALTAAFAGATSQELDPKLAKLSKEVEAARVESHTPGLSLAVVKDGKLILAQGFGYKDVASKAPVTADTQFAIGSATKAFVAMLTAMSGDAGHIQFNDPPRKWLPDFQLYDPKANEKMTMGDLMSHKVGLPRTDLIWYTGVLNTEELLWAMSKVKPTAEFGTRFQYQNIMFAAVGEALKKAEGKDWEQQAQEKIFNPLGMTNSNFSVADMEKAPDFANGYAYIGGKEEYMFLPSRDIPSVSAAGAINSSAKDMAKWVQFMLDQGEVGGKQLVSKERFEELIMPHMVMGPNSGYGYGWFLQQWKGKKIAQHGGNIDGFSALVGFMPEEKLGFVALTNGSASPLPNQVMNLVWSNLVTVPEDPKATVAEIPPMNPEKEVGTYHLDVANLDMVVTLEGGKLKLQPTGQPKLDLIHLGDRKFKAAPPAPDGVFITFQDSKEKSGKVEAIFEQNGQRFVMKQPEPYAADITVASLMQKVVDALGGEQAIKSIKTLRFNYAADMENQGVVVVGTRSFKAPNEFADVSIARAAGRTIATFNSFYDGKVGVEDVSFAPTDIKSGAALGDHILSGYLVPEMYWKTLFADAKITGTAKAGDQECYIVELMPKSGTKIVEWVSKADYRVLRRQTGAGQSLGTDIYEDFKQVNGVWIPFKTTRESGLIGRTITTIDAVEVNVPLRDSIFKLAPRKAG